MQCLAPMYLPHARRMWVCKVVPRFGCAAGRAPLAGRLGGPLAYLDQIGLQRSIHRRIQLL